eukprot:CAMPEP_0118947998 /NCGR_PEP_ID=MMETSP1169-20130426/47057_1 /TAXON_ID=36882 /ORGANISM="Pyramimonas obovata, Strain CCMP722" /LENGTH=105 /DNA_ID=CAMNT_0006894331 /DNA_START=240 /DNA_END=554 /DNA_ORIENTATION=-
MNGPGRSKQSSPNSGGTFVGVPDASAKQAIRFQIYRDKECTQMLRLDQAVEETAFPLYLKGIVYQTSLDYKTSTFDTVTIKGWRRVPEQPQQGGYRVFVFSKDSE